jgi:hypothetical protein
MATTSSSTGGSGSNNNSRSNNTGTTGERIPLTSRAGECTYTCGDCGQIVRNKQLSFPSHFYHETNPHIIILTVVLKI